MLDDEKHPSLFFHNVNDEEKSFMTLTLGRFINGKPSEAFWYDFHSIILVRKRTKQGTLT